MTNYFRLALSVLLSGYLCAGETASADPIVVSSGKQVIDAKTISGANSLSVSNGATAVIDFGRASSLTITGNITNSGNIFAVSSNPTISTATFHAQNIFNNQGALFSTILPAALSNYYPSTHLNLSLIAINQIVNAGTISSAANLSLNAGSIVNSGILNAAQNLNVISQLGNIVNSGIISANAGNLNISSLAGQSLIINNLNGVMQSLMGSVNFSTTATSDTLAKMNIAVTGGDIVGKVLNFTTSNGDVDIAVNKLEGTLNITGCSAHVLADTPTLSLGQMVLTGDPTFYNTGGGINISADLLFNPVQFVSAPVGLAIVAAGDITASNGVTQISNNASPSANWPTGAAYNGDILIVAGAQFTATPTDGSQSSTGSFPAGGDTTNQLTVTGASATGGSINLPNVSINSQAGLVGPPAGSANSGNVTLLAYGAGAGTGNISIGSIVTGQTNLITNDVSGTNGSVTIVGSGNITVGSINTSGNYLNTNLNNGNIIMASATIDMLQMLVPTNSFSPTQTLLQTGAIYGGVTNTAALPGSNTLYMTSTAGIAVGNTLVLDPQGPDYEQVTVQSINSTTNSITTSSAILNNHTAGEAVYLRPNQVGMSNIINAGAGTPPGTPMIFNNNLFAPNLNNLSSGTITVNGAIVGTGAITLATGTGGSIQLNNSLSLTINPTTATPNPLNFLRLPVINLTAPTITVASGATVNSNVSGCNFCPSSINIATGSLSNNGTIGATTGSNTLVNVFSSTGLNVSGTGTFAVPSGSVIELAAADNNSLNLNSSLNFSTGAVSAVILDAQRSSGAININGNLNFSGGPVVSINSPNITAASGIQLISTTGNGSFLFSSGYTADPLTVNLTNSFTLSGAPAAFTPYFGQNLIFNGTSSFTTSSPVLFQASGGGAIQGVSNLTLSGNVYQSTNPNGMIQGFEFQPYIGGRISSTNSQFVQFSAYPYQEVLALLANSMAVTDSNTGIVAPPFQYVSTYTQVSSTGYVIPAAKQLGLRVSAGVFADINADTLGSMSQSSFNTALYDTQAALQGAAKYGNVMDIVVGNEDIVAGSGTNASYSMTTLQNLIQGGPINIQFVAGTSPAPGAQPTRNATINPLTGTNFTSATLPVVTRQKDGVLNLVTDPLQANANGMIALMNALDGYVYSNTYPFFDQSNVVPALLSNPGITQSQFTTLVTTYLTNSFTTNATNFATAGVATKIRIGETGWATPMTQASADALKGYYGASLPQQNTTWASWYYPAVQNWSSTIANSQTGGNGVIVADYFASYDEPWKGVIGKAPNATIVNVGSGAIVGLSSLPTNNGAIFYNPTLTPMSVAINPGGSNLELQNYFNPNPGTNNLPISSTNYPSSLVFAHSTSEQIVAGSPQEPFFGLYTTTGSNLSTGSIYTLSGVTQKYSAVPINLTQLSTAPTSSITAAPSSTLSSSSSPVASFFAGDLSAQLGSVSNTTILQTDINPERTSDIQQPQSNAFVSSNNTDNSTLASTFQNNILPNPEGNFVNLPQGSAFFLPDHEIVVQTPLAKVNIATGAAVMIFQSEAGLSVFNVYDNKAGDVAVMIGDESQELGVGRQLSLVNEQHKQLKDIVPNSIAVRDVRYGSINRKKMISSQFSHASAISNFAGLRNLFRSDSPQDRQKADRILKTAAALVLMNKNTAAYQSPN